MTEDSPIWRLKYQPQALDDVAGRENTISRLKEILQKGNFPHLLFVGSEGIGKTTIARLFAKEFLGRYYDANFKLVYADVPLSQGERKQARSESYVSTSRIGSMAGKKVTTPAFIQVKIKPFVQLKVIGDVPFKILVVKNFEVLGSDQQGFRRLMEIYGSNCRMILITTKISGIIDPIISRCQLFLIPQIKYENFQTLIKSIAQKESLELESGTVEFLYRISEGKIANAIDLLQLSSARGKKIDLNVLYNNMKQFRNQEIRELLKKTFTDEFKEARELFREILSEYKYNAHELFVKILEEIHKLPFSQYTKSKIINMIADADVRALEGLDDDIQISALITKLAELTEWM
jgi:replication factor C small subunit